MGVTERLLIMETMNNIKIDQLRINIPYDEIYQVEDSQGLYGNTSRLYCDRQSTI